MLGEESSCHGICVYSLRCCSLCSLLHARLAPVDTGSLSSTRPSTRAGKTYADVRALCTMIGYMFTEDAGEHELYTAGQVECAAGQTLYWFSSTANRDKWRAVALQFGGAYVVGDVWAVDAESARGGARARCGVAKSVFPRGAFVDRAQTRPWSESAQSDGSSSPPVHRSTRGVACAGASPRNVSHDRLTCRS